MYGLDISLCCLYADDDTLTKKAMKECLDIIVIIVNDDRYSKQTKNAAQNL